MAESTLAVSRREQRDKAMAAATHKGVYYVCQRCTACCKWPGDVILEEGEAERIADFLGMKVDAFIQEHTHLSENRKHLSLLENPDHSCVWLQGADCTLQEVKPRQCAGFPNEWNFKGWKSHCEAIPVPLSAIAENPALAFSPPPPSRPSAD